MRSRQRLSCLPVGTLRNVSLLIALPALALLGCGDGTGGEEDVQSVAGDVGALAGTPGAASTITFATFTDDVGDQAATETRTLIRNARGYQSLFGHAPPASVDFSREWVMFYAENGSVLIPNAPPVTGRDNIRAMLAPVLHDPRYAYTFRAERIEGLPER